MNLRKSIWLAALAILTQGGITQAQDLAGAAGGVAGAPGAAAPAAAAGPNLFTMLLPPPELTERCRQKICKCEVIKMLAAGMQPASLATGGLIPAGNCCPTIRKEDLAKPAESSEGAAARIKKDVEESAARREAVRYLSTVDCRYWPEAEEALINALRADKIECVRYEAAVALQRGCCCTKKVAKALTISIEGTEKDGFPAERSMRVRDAAAVALSMCVFETEVAPKEAPKDDKKPIARVNPKDFYKNVDNSSYENVYDGARKVLEKRNANINSTQVISHPHRASSQGLLGILSHAVESTNETAIASSQTIVTPTPPAAVASQQPQRRGLLYKLMPGTNGTAEDPMVAYTVPTQTPAPQFPAPAMMPSVPVAAMPPVAPQTRPQVRPPVANEIRQTGYVSGAPTYGTMTTEEPSVGFSTAGPQSLPGQPLPAAPIRPATPPAPQPVPQTRNPGPQPEQGLLGFVIMEDAPRR